MIYNLIKDKDDWVNILVAVLVWEMDSWFVCSSIPGRNLQVKMEEDLEIEINIYGHSNKVGFHSKYYDEIYVYVREYTTP